MGSLFGGGGGVETVNPPKPIKLKLGQLERRMISADQAAYGAADDYMSKYYPALTQGRDAAIEQAYNALTGPLNPSLQNTFVNAANMRSIGALGGGDQNFGFAPGGGGFGGGGAGSDWGKIGSLARNAAAAGVATQEQGYQDYNRSLFQQLNTMYAPRSFGMTPEDAANVFTFNNTQYNNFLQQKFGAQTQAYYTNQGLAAQSGAAGTGLIAGLASSVIQGLIAY